MRLALTIIGIICSILVVFGSLFKLQHYPGGSMMLVLGVFLFAFPFLILLLIHRIRNGRTGLEQAEGVVKVITLWFLSVGTLFLVQHYPGGHLLNIMGQQLLAFVYLPILLVRFYQEKEFRKSISLLSLAIAFGGFSMLLVYQSSKSILEMYVRNEGLVQQSTIPMLELNSKIGESKDSSSRSGIAEVRRDARKVCDSIKAYEHHLIRECGDFPEGTPDSLISLERSSQIGNYDVPTHILVGGDPASPHQGQWSAHRLKKLLIGYRDRLIERAKSDRIKEKLRQKMSYKVEPGAYPRQQSWESIYFYRMPLAGVINTLSALRANVLASAELVASDMRSNGRNSREGKKD